MSEPMTKKEKVQLWMICFFSALGILMWATKSSFLYPFQDGMDVNCFFTTGKSMFRGLVLYRDIYEHKGIIVYLIYGLASLIDHTGFGAVFILEIICHTFFLYYSYRLIRLFVSGNYYFILPILSLAVCSGYAFSYGGQVEELALPILAWGFYLFMEYMQRDDGTELSLGQVFLCGFWSAVLFWMKYTLTGLYLALVLIMFCIKLKEKKYKLLGKYALSFTGGFALVTAAVICYFAYHHALNDLWQVYFYNLLFHYNARDIGMSRLEYSVRKILLTFWRNKRFSLLIVLGVLWATCSSSVKKRTKISLWVVCVITTAAIFYSAQYNRYWGLVLAVFAPIGIAVLIRCYSTLVTMKKGKLIENEQEKDSQLKIGQAENHKIENQPDIKGYGAFVISLIISIVLISQVGMNTYLLKYSREDMPQYRFREVILEDLAAGVVESAEVFNYGCLDLGLYTVMDQVPGCKYFCDYNIYLEEIEETQRDYILSGGPDYIIMRSPLNIAEDRYELVSTCEFEMEFENYYQTYYFYRKLSN